MVIVPFPDYLIIHRVIQKLQPRLLKLLELFFVRRQETHIEMCRIHDDPVRFGRIKRFEGLGDVLDRIRIFQMIPQNYHLVRKRCSVAVPRQTGRVIQASGAGSRKQHCCRKQEVFHSAVHFLAANIALVFRLPHKKSLKFGKIRPGTEIAFSRRRKTAEKPARGTGSC